jgi:hypothetical protein
VAEGRNLAAILAADVVGFSRLTGTDEIAPSPACGRCIRGLRRRRVDPPRGSLGSSSCAIQTPRRCSSISRKSPATSPRAPTPCCCSTALDGTQPPSSTRHAASRRSSCVHVPELNPVENVWQFLRGNWLSNLVFEPTTTSSRCLRRLAKTHRAAQNHHIHRHARMGPHRSDPMTPGFCLTPLAGSGAARHWRRLQG